MQGDLIARKEKSSDSYAPPPLWGGIYFRPLHRHTRERLSGYVCAGPGISAEMLQQLIQKAGNFPEPLKGINLDLSKSILTLKIEALGYSK